MAPIFIIWVYVLIFEEIFSFVMMIFHPESYEGLTIFFGSFEKKFFQIFQKKYNEAKHIYF